MKSYMPMKMKELEERTGVGREAIRFYIREGLLPEPERPKKNVARYSDAHIIRLKAIRRLQEERFLPLSVIKALLAADEGAAAIDAQAFPALDRLLRDKLHASSENDKISLQQLMDETGLEDHQIENLDMIGMITIICENSQSYVQTIDASIARIWAQLNAVGFTEERGFTVEAARIYVEFVEWLTKAEVKMFYEHLANKLSTEDAAKFGERGITLVNEVITHMRTKAILRELKQLNAQQESQRLSAESGGSASIK